jgi:DNA polymerase-3 subunit alpha
LRHTDVTVARVGQLKEILAQHRGSTEVRVNLSSHRGARLLRLPAHPVTVTPALLADLKALLGPANVA